MGNNNTTKKKDAVKAEETPQEADISCQSYSRLQESDRTTEQCQLDDSQSSQKSDDKTLLTKQPSNACCADDEKRKPGKGNEKKTEKLKKEKKKNTKYVLIDMAVNIENENESALMEEVVKKSSVETKLDDDVKQPEIVCHSTETARAINTVSNPEKKDEVSHPNLIAKEGVVRDIIHCNKELDILVVTNTDTEIKNGSNRIKSIGELDDNSLIKKEITENHSIKTKVKSKSTKSKKVSKQLDDTNVDASDKDNNSEKSSKKPKNKQDKAEEAFASKKSKKEKTVKSKDAKKAKPVESDGTVKVMDVISTSHEKDKAAGSKDSKKKKIKKDKNKHTCKDTITISQVMSLTLSEDASSTQEKDEQIQTESHIFPESKTSTDILDVENQSGNRTALLCKANDMTEIAKNGIYKDTEHFATDKAECLNDSVLQQGREEMIDKYVVTVKTPIAEHCCETNEKTKNSKARKDSVNQKKKVKSEKKTQTENGKNSNIYSVLLTDVEESGISEKKLPKKELKKKHDDTVVSKKLSKKEKKMSKKGKKPKEENVRLLESESSIECRSKNSVSSMERIRQTILLDDLVLPEQLDMDMEGISLSSVSLDGTDDVFSVSKSTHVEVNHEHLDRGIDARNTQQHHEMPIVTGPDTSVIDVSMVRL